MRVATSPPSRYQRTKVFTAKECRKLWMRGRHEGERGSKPTCRSSWRKVGWTVSWRSRMPRVETKKLGADGKQVHPNPVEIRGAHRPALGDRGAHLVSSLDGYHLSASCILIPKRALTLAPEAGAQCRNSARWDLRGGRPQGRSLPRSLQGDTHPWPARCSQTQFGRDTVALR